MPSGSSSPRAGIWPRTGRASHCPGQRKRKTRRGVGHDHGELPTSRRGVRAHRDGCAGVRRARQRKHRAGRRLPVRLASRRVRVTAPACRISSSMYRGSSAKNKVALAGDELDRRAGDLSAGQLRDGRRHGLVSCDAAGQRPAVEHPHLTRPVCWPPNWTFCALEQRFPARSPVTQNRQGGCLWLEQFQISLPNICASPRAGSTAASGTDQPVRGGSQRRRAEPYGNSPGAGPGPGFAPDHERSGSHWCAQAVTVMATRQPR